MSDISSIGSSGSSSNIPYDPTSKATLTSSQEEVLNYLQTQFPSQLAMIAKSEK